MIEASFFPNPIAERAPHDQPHHQFDALGSGIAEICDMRYTGETVCIARQVVEKRLVKVAVDQAGPRSLKLVAHPPRTPYLDIEVIREALHRFPEGRAEGVATRPSLLDGRYRDADCLTLIMDQLNIHSAASLYEAFPPEDARRLAERLDIHHTPKHGSWLNMAEIELSALARQALSCRLARQDTLERRVADWEAERNAAGTTIDWQFTTGDARVKLRRLYPSF